jgi:N-acetylglucosaminyldiphosphoundecaprenol N-acetyl-beta-D-mannosaminyltransferase
MEAGKTPFERRQVLQAAVDLAAPRQIVDYLTECIQNRSGCAVAGISAPYAVAVAADPAMREAFLSMDLLIPDGKGFCWGARLLGVPCGERLAIPDLCEELLALGNQRSWRVFVYGATEKVNAAACLSLRQRFPNLGAVAGQHGYNQTAAAEDALIERLEREQFNLVLVARPTPAKEEFLRRCCRSAGLVGIAAGGYADILAGLTARAPRLVQTAGFEWLYRVVQEPRRLWKRIGWANLRFAAAVLWRLLLKPATVLWRHLLKPATVLWRHLLKPAARPWWSCSLVQICLLILVVSAAYLPALNAPYHFDDPEYIEKNPAIRSFGALSGITVLKNRKLWWLSNAICYKLSELFGNHQTARPDVRFFRAWNILCQLIAALALWGLLRRSLRASGHLTSPGDNYSVAAFGAAAIFAAHPLCTESVTYICGRDNGQGGMFYLLGLYAAAVAFARMSPAAGSAEKNRAEKKAVWPRWVWPLIFALAFGGCAVLTKESYLSYPFAVALLYFCFFRGAARYEVSVGLLAGVAAAAAAFFWGTLGRYEGCLGVAFELAAFFILLGAVLGGRPAGEQAAPGSLRAFFRKPVAGGWLFLLVAAGMIAVSVGSFSYAYERLWAAFTGYNESSPLRSLASQAYAIPWMLLRCVAPYGLNIDHDFPTLNSLSDPQALKGAAAVLALIIFGLVGMYKRWLGGFGILLALISIAPTNSVIERGDIVSERNFYLAAAGGACLLAWLITLLGGWIGRRITEPGAAGASWEAGIWTAVLCCCVAGPFVAFTIVRNQDWEDPYRLWDSALQRSPGKMRVLHNYGVAAMARYERSRSADEDYMDKADWAFNQAITIGEKKLEKNMFRPDEVMELLCFQRSYAYLASLQLKRYEKHPESGAGSLKSADAILRKGMERTAYDPDMAMAFTEFLFQRGNASESVGILQQSLNLHPWADYLRWPLGAAYLESGDYKTAETYLQQALSVQEHHSLGISLDQPLEQQAEIHAYLGLAEAHLKQWDGARADFAHSMQCDLEGGVVAMLTSCRQAFNPKLKPIETAKPDILVLAISKTWRGVLETLRGSLDDLARSEPEKDKTRRNILRAHLNYELDRRSKTQKKREEAGFTDNPDSFMP